MKHLPHGHCHRLAFFWAFLGAALAPAPLKFLALSFFCRIFSALLIFDLALMPACPRREVCQCKNRTVWGTLRGCTGSSDCVDNRQHRELKKTC